MLRRCLVIECALRNFFAVLVLFPFFPIYPLSGTTLLVCWEAMLRMIFDIHFSAITILSVCDYISLVYCPFSFLKMSCVLCCVCVYLNLKVIMKFSGDNLGLNGYFLSLVYCLFFSEDVLHFISCVHIPRSKSKNANFRFSEDNLCLYGS